jgi:hypothetical protein
MSQRHSVLVALVLIGSGALWPANSVSAAADEPKPVVYLVGGIGHMIILSPSAKFVFPIVGVDYELRDFKWQHEWGTELRDLFDEAHLRRKSVELADEVRELHEREPNRRIYLIGHSAGAAVVLHAAELLPPNSIDRIILLSPAVSPNYDLTLAFQATKHEIVAFTSRFDGALHATCVFGTADRIFCTSAGLRGFKCPENLDGEGKHCYERLIQIPWTFDCLLELQGCWHNSSTMPLFLARRVAPWLKEPAPIYNKPE